MPRGRKKFDDPFDSPGFSITASNFEEVRRQKLAYIQRLKHDGINELELPAREVYRRLGVKINPGPQKQFLELPDEDMDVLYGGAAGGGKSFALLVLALRSCARYPKFQAFWFRRTFPELEQSVLRMLGRFGYAKSLGCVWNDGKKELRFANGSILTFAHAKNVQEADALRSAEINLLILDERTTINPSVVDLLYTRIRSGVMSAPCLGVRSATNPGGPGHGRVRKEYVEATDYGKNIIEEDKYGRRRIFIQAYAHNTPQLGQAYMRSLEGLPEELRRAFLEGDWSTFSGQIFTELRHDRHVVDPMPLPETWRRYAGIDWGYAAPFAVLWGALDEDSRIWLYRERYQAKVTETEQARRILESEGDEHVIARFADDAMWASRGEAKAIAAVYEDNGVHIEKAGKGNGSRTAGFARIHSYLSESTPCKYHAAKGWETCPRLHIMSTCKELYRELENLPYAETGNVEDSDPHADDHAVDALRYLLVNIGQEPQWFFMNTDSVEELMLKDDNLNRPQTPVPMIAGHPILEGSHPWDS